MTLKTWKTKYYPVPANEVRGRMKALLHSETKWSGLSAVILKKYGLERADLATIRDAGKEKLGIDKNSCALCALYFDFRECEKCPLVAVRKMSCDEPRGKSPYSAWTRGGNPKPMLKLIRAAIKTETK